MVGYTIEGTMSNLVSSTENQKISENVGTDLRQMTLLVDYSNADRKWEHYGHVLCPVLFRNRFGKIDNNSGYKLWVQNNEQTGFKELERKLLRDTQLFYPHEEVYKNLTDIFEEKLKGSQLRILKSQSSHSGDSMFWEIVSDRFIERIKDSFVEEDDVQLGAVIRNGIGTNIGLGVDLFTYRLKCKNGAIARGTELGSFVYRHVGRNYERITDGFKEGIEHIIEKVKALVQRYQAAAYRKLNQRIVEQLYDNVRISDKYMPPWMVVDEDLRAKKKDPKYANDTEIQTKPVVSITPSGQNTTLWEGFNDITSQIWHSSSLTMQGKSLIENNLHRVLIANV